MCTYVQRRESAQKNPACSLTATVPKKWAFPSDAKDNSCNCDPCDCIGTRKMYYSCTNGTFSPMTKVPPIGNPSFDDQVDMGLKGSRTSMYTRRLRIKCNLLYLPSSMLIYLHDV